ncbi:MAG: hypothetical protein EKK61_05170 [Rickettsiales bacterium]|nr:MAG: hypothetical protein EKK61_05170 [Rickettsiales bacterium]
MPKPLSCPCLLYPLPPCSSQTRHSSYDLSSTPKKPLPSSPILLTRPIAKLKEFLRINTICLVAEIAM